MSRLPSTLHSPPVTDVRRGGPSTFEHGRHYFALLMGIAAGMIPYFVALRRTCGSLLGRMARMINAPFAMIIRRPAAIWSKRSARPIIAPLIHYFAPETGIFAGMITYFVAL